jgi:hypothetical protein
MSIALLFLADIQVPDTGSIEYRRTMSGFFLLQCVMLLEFIIDKRAYHGAIDLLDNDFGKPCFGGLFTHFIDNLLDPVRSTNGRVVGLKSGSGFDALAALGDQFNQFTINLIDAISNVIY